MGKQSRINTNRSVTQNGVL